MFKTRWLLAISFSLVLAWAAGSSCGKLFDGGSSGNPSGPPPSSTGPTLDAFVSPTAAAAITLTGRTLRASDRIRVDGGSAPVETTSGTDKRFSVDVVLRPNRLNNLYVTEFFSEGTTSPIVPAQVVQDSQPPTFFIDFPPAGAILADDTTNVSGRVSDVLSGFAGLEVTVNGHPAVVNIGIGTNGTFDIPGVALRTGFPTPIVVEARDAVGNVSGAEVRVSHVRPTGNRMEFVSGGNQSGEIHSVLADPIGVRVLSLRGTPVVGKVVTWEVTRSDGRLSGDARREGTLRFQSLTGSDGVASAYWRLGGDAGCGNNRVKVSSVDIAGTLYFCASAHPGPPSQINVGSGDEQIAQASGPAPEPLRAWVSDGCNGVAGASVTFTVVEGGGALTGGGQVNRPSVTVVTGPTGHAAATLVLGGAPGNNRVEATLVGVPPSDTRAPAVFTVLGRAVTPDATSFEGLVFDNAMQPIGGVACRLSVGPTDFEAVTNERGRFEFLDLSTSGPAELHVDGTTATLLGGQPIDTAAVRFPSLHYTPVVIPNTRNALPRPILLPGLDPANDVQYDGTSDVSLHVQGVAGLEMRVKKGSATLLPGTRLLDGTVLTEATTPTPASPLPSPAILALNQVHADDVPMRPGDGAAPPFAWTLQPGGTHFGPPVEVTYPNISGLPPGAASYFLSFNHDTGRFEIVATGSVSADGSTIRSDPGSGISVAGWGCNCPPYAVAGECRDCRVTIVEAFAAGDSDPTASRVVCCVDQEVTFSAHSDTGAFEWTGGSSIGSTDQSVYRARFTEPGEYQVTCACRGGTAGSEVTVSVVRVQFDPSAVRSADDFYAGTIRKCMPLAWNQIAQVDLALLLASGSYADSHEVEVQWQVSVNGSPLTPNDHTLPVGPTIGADHVRVFEIHAVRPGCPDDNPNGHDAMYLTVHPPQTTTTYQQWTIDNEDIGWCNELPPIYSSLLPNQMDPEANLAGPVFACPNDKWNEPCNAGLFCSIGTNYHPGAGYEMRSRATEHDHGHQATYSATGDFLATAPAAGTADMVHYLNIVPFLPSHFDADVLPFVLAAQLDGNPVNYVLGGADLDRPLMRVGDNLRAYVARRPITVSGSTPVSPGTCIPGALK